LKALKRRKLVQQRLQPQTNCPLASAFLSQLTLAGTDASPFTPAHQTIKLNQNTQPPQYLSQKGN